MAEKKIQVTENIGIARFREYVRVGIPFAKGEVFGSESFLLLSPEEEEQPLQLSPLNYWSDGSIKWMLLDFAATAASRGREVYRLKANGKERVRCDNPRIDISRAGQSWRVDTGALKFFIDAGQFRPFACVIETKGQIPAVKGSCALMTKDNESTIASMESISVEAEGPLRSILAIRGRFMGKSSEICRFSSRIHLFAGSSCCRLDVTVHNPRRAEHRGGFWDLGDAGSLLFKSLTFQFSFQPDKVTEIRCCPEPGRSPVQCRQDGASVSVYQESSGGRQWLSPIHRNRDGRIPLKKEGYEIIQGDSRIAVGKRATPIIWCGRDGSGVSAVLPHFWQEFPKAITGSRRGLKVGLFPACFPDLHELQGGEQKTHTIYLDFDCLPNGLEWARSPLSVMPSSRDVHHSKVMFDLPYSGNQSDSDDLIAVFTSGPDEFLRKREAADEYGWRNFGDVHADHEGVYHQGKNTFVSHYNNQYDICAGMYRKCLATGDWLWGNLASDLAKHVLDIDIYHTDRDRDEYNQGLFWHTDHYAPAGLSTHRSFSTEQIGGRDPDSCGGGPGAEHCYTTGLMLSYFLTGNEKFREAVIGLADWSYNSITGCNTVLAAINAASGYLSQLRTVDRGSKKLFPRFPLSRGTGNAINASLDAYDVTGHGRFLQHAEELIQGSIHPDDDPNARNLLDAENAWSYTVLLTSVIKYLFKKEEQEDLDYAYSYARASLLTYAEWMACHEYPYLDRPEILGYPNETWPAQDLRKSVVLYHAAKYSNGERRKAYLERASFFYLSAKEELARRPTTSFTRPLALIFQNGWIGQRLKEEQILESKTHSAASSFGKPTPYLDAVTVIRRIAGELGRSLCKISLRREYSWLSSRLG